MSTEKKIIIVGPSGSGKDTLRKRLEEKGYKYGPLDTSRPKREGEENGKDYYFTTKNRIDFDTNTNKNLFHFTFGQWVYALSKCVWKTSNLFIFSPPYFDALPEALDYTIIYLRPSLATIYDRLLARGTDPVELKRRFLEDVTLFDEWEKKGLYTFKITNPDF